jgi:hypothetical protein
MRRVIELLERWHVDDLDDAEVEEAGGAIGPVLGGVLLERFWWGSVFLLAVPVMALLLALGPRVLPEYRDPAAGRLDLVSAAMSLVAVLAVVFGLKLIAQDGVGGLASAAILVGLLVGVAFVRRQLTLADPMIDLRLGRPRGSPRPGPSSVARSAPPSWAASASPHSSWSQSARRCWPRPARRTPRGCSSPSRSAPRSRAAPPSWPRSCSGQCRQPLRPSPARPRPPPPSLPPPPSGCLACPGERRPSELPRFKLPEPSPDNPSPPTS